MNVTDEVYVEYNSETVDVKDSVGECDTAVLLVLDDETVEGV